MSISEQDRAVAGSIADILDESRRIYFITGAGVSADSGLPTYRGIGGLYNNGGTDEGVSIEDAISGPMMEQNPALPWKYLSLIESACRAAGPNRAHNIIAEMQDHFNVWVLTQNIDGFHRAAGSRQIIDIHGDLQHLICTVCGRRETVENYGSLGTLPPVCPECGNVIRPEVVLFGEQLPGEKCDLMVSIWDEPFDLVFSIGTTSVFPYIAQPVIYAGHRGIPTIEINPGDTAVSHLVDYRLKMGAGEAMELLWKTWRDRVSG